MRVAALLLALAVPGAARAQDAPRYTPVEAWRDADDAKWKQAWFGKHLASMQAPYLVPDAAMEGYRERFRMLVLPTFDRPYAVMVDRRRDGRATVRMIVTDGRGGYGAGKIVNDVVRPLSTADWDHVVDSIASARLSQRRTDSGSGGGEFAGGARAALGDRTISGICTDGTQIVFEQRTAAGYRIVTRHECSLDAPMRGLTEATLALTGRSFDRREGYVLQP